MNARPVRYETLWSLDENCLVEDWGLPRHGTRPVVKVPAFLGLGRGRGRSHDPGLSRQVCRHCQSHRDQRRSPELKTHNQQIPKTFQHNHRAQVHPVMPGELQHTTFPMRSQSTYQ
jgi:hypothetical protein